MKIHFIGIGGIGTSALAKYYLAQGLEVSGSDLANSQIIEDLKKSGTQIFIGPHRERNILERTNLVVYSAAVESKNPELIEAHRRKIKCQTYAQALGELTKKYFTIAVSGTHGKSTTTAMIALILTEAGLDPTVIAGTKLREFGDSNFRAGKSNILVIEADEYSASFLNYWPKIIVLTNIEEDHLDYYRDLKHILVTFKKYIEHLSAGEVLIANEDDENIKKIVQTAKCKVQNYNSKLEIDELNLKIPGRHNLMNAYAAITAARAQKIPDEISVKALNNFSGTWRRFEYKGTVSGAKIFDDYGHHPTEIEATLKGARALLNKNKKPHAGSHLWCVFQPHQHQRTYQLFNKFSEAFGEADKIILLDIFSVAGREKDSIKKLVSSQKLAEAIKNKGKEAYYFSDKKEAVEFLKSNLKAGDLAIIMGAGDIYRLTEEILA